MSKKNIYIALFAILYVCVGLVSTIHAISFFGLANAPVLGTILAITFEIGQAAVLFNLLTSPGQRKKFMPWALMSILTLVQILGNIFSSYKYIVTNSPENLRYFKEPIFIWTDIPDDMATVIVTYIVGAILPIVALCLTEMVTSYLYGDDKKKPDVQPQINNVDFNSDSCETIDEGEDETPVITTAKDVEEVNDKLIKEYDENHKEDDIVEIEPEPVKTPEPEPEIQQEIKEEKIEQPTQKPIQKPISPEVEEIFNTNKKSHFINM